MIENLCFASLLIKCWLNVSFKCKGSLSRECNTWLCMEKMCATCCPSFLSVPVARDQRVIQNYRYAIPNLDNGQCLLYAQTVVIERIPILRGQEPSKPIFRYSRQTTISATIALKQTASKYNSVYCFVLIHYYFAAFEWSLQTLVKRLSAAARLVYNRARVAIQGLCWFLLLVFQLLCAL